MTRTYINDDGVLVVDAGPVVLESTAGLGEAERPADWQHLGWTDGNGEVFVRDVRDSAGE